MSGAALGYLGKVAREDARAGVSSAAGDAFLMLALGMMYQAQLATLAPLEAMAREGERTGAFSIVLLADT